MQCGSDNYQLVRYLRQDLDSPSGRPYFGDSTKPLEQGSLLVRITDLSLPD